MKKIIAFVLTACMVLSLAACGSKPATEQKPAEAEYKLGMGVVVSTDSSKTGNAQVDATVAAVVTDAAGKIVACRIDVAQNKMDITGGAVDAAKTFKTKVELGDDYNMAKYGSDNNGDGIVKEWDEQTLAFEAYVVGKTGAEVACLELKEAAGHMISVDENLLKAGCTMQITDFMAAIKKACEDPAAVSFKTAGEFKLGVSAISEASESVAAVAGTDGTVKMYSEFGAAVVGADGKILAALNDAIQPKITINVAGEIVEAAFTGTKRELGDNYNMVKFGGAIAEWDAQSAAFSKYVIGKSAAEVRAIETKTNDHGYLVAVDTALYTGCTMQITGMMAVIATAAEYAR